MTRDGWDLSLEAALRRLQAGYGAGWMVWYVPCWDGIRSQQWFTWCAKRHTDGRLLHATRPEHLAEYLAAAEAERGAGGQPGT